MSVLPRAVSFLLWISTASRSVSNGEGGRVNMSADCLAPPRIVF
jgi:hypothetical protein